MRSTLFIVLAGLFGFFTVAGLFFSFATARAGGSTVVYLWPPMATSGPPMATPGLGTPTPTPSSISGSSGVSVTVRSVVDDYTLDGVSLGVSAVCLLVTIIFGILALRSPRRGP
jgi:hypothetical protein